CNHLSLEKEFIGQRIFFRSVLRREYVSHTRHLLGHRHVESFDSRTRMGTGEHSPPEHVRQQNPSSVLRLADISGYRNFWHRRMRLPYEIEILRRVALPLLRDDLRVAFDQRIFWTVTATGGEIPHHRLIYDDDVFGFCFDFFLGFLILTHCSPLR